MQTHPSALFRSRRVVAGTVGVAALGIGMAIALATAAPGPIAAAGSPRPTPSRVATATERATEPPTPTASPTPEPRILCPLDGMPVADGLDASGTALAVQIENHPGARPARNLSNADMVVETTVEGGTTRFTGIFLCDRTDGMTGPVRSARYYAIDLWRDLHVLTVAYGSSNGAHQRFLDAGMPYPDGVRQAWPWYQRYGPRPAPHNLYVDLEALRGALDDNAAVAALAGRVDEIRAPFAFHERARLPGDDERVREISIRTTASWHIGWTWEAEADRGCAPTRRCRCPTRSPASGLRRARWSCSASPRRWSPATPTRAATIGGCTTWSGRVPEPSTWTDGRTRLAGAARPMPTARRGRSRTAIR